MEEAALTLSTEDKSNLLDTARWGRFLGIVGFIISGFIVLVGLVFIGGTFGDELGGLYASMGSSVGVIYLLAALLYIFPSLYVFKFSNQIKQGIRENNQTKCSLAYGQLKKLFVFMGVMMIIVLVLYALAILGIVVGGVLGDML